MLKLYRNVVMVGLVGLGLAACGDKVTVTQPVTPVPGVTSVTVAPANLTIAINQEVQYAVSVIADAGVATSVVWGTGNTAIATVTTDGKVKGVTAGTTTITATSTADPNKKGIASVTVSATAPNILSFTISPTSAALAPGNIVQITPIFVMTPGAPAPTVTYSIPAADALIATVSSSGKVTASAFGTTIVTATAVSGATTLTASMGLTVRALTPATVSVSSVTTGILTLPVTLTNVFGQIEFNLNFNPGEQPIDSVRVVFGTKRAAMQSFTSNPHPAAGILTLSVNTANFTKFPATGVALVDWTNGPTVAKAEIYVAGALQAVASDVLPLVLNNVDGWAADITKPGTPPGSASAVAAVGNFNAGYTYWGGPTAPVSAVLYPVVYTPNRTVVTATWGMGAGGVDDGTCRVVAQAFPFIRTFGGTAGQSACAYQNQVLVRDNIVVSLATDNNLNGYPLVLGANKLIANTVVFGATPDSLRLDYVGPVVSQPSIARAAPAVTGWVNATFPFTQTSATTDVGVGVRAATDRTYTYSAPNCGGATNQPMPNANGGDIPECATNFIGGAPGLGGTAPYTVKATESDRLGNTTTSIATQTFGVDKTKPAIRWGLVQVAPALVASISADTTTFVAKPGAANLWRAEYLDERSGFSATAQTHSLSVGAHIFPAGSCAIGTSTPGLLFVTAPACGMVAATPGALRLDGWQSGQSVAVPQPEQYAAYTTTVTDAAGNPALAPLFAKTLVNALAPFATGLGIPAQLTFNNFGFLSTGADSAEASGVALQLTYPALAGLGGTDSVRYNQFVIGTRFDNVITSPFATTVSPTTGAPYVHSIELVDGSKVFGTDPSNIFAVGTQVKPTKLQTFTFNFGGYNTPSAEILIPALNVENNATIAAFNTANPTIAVNFWRVIPSIATTNQFGSTVPLRAQATAPTSSPNPPFTRVDFYQLNAGGWYSYLGSVSSANREVSTACVATAAEVCGTDQGTYRSWVYQLPTASFVKAWNGATQGALVATNTVIAVGVLSTGDAVSTIQVVF